MVTVDSSRAGNLGELVAPDKFPVLAVPLHEGTGRNVELFLRKLPFLSVVGIHSHSLSGIETLAVITREEGAKVSSEAFLPLLVAVLVKLYAIKGMDIDIVETGFHRSVENTVVRIRQMTCKTGRTARELIVWERPDILVGVDRVWADEELSRLVMDHAVSRSTANTLGTDNLFQGRSDLIQFVIRSERLVRRI